MNNYKCLQYGKTSINNYSLIPLRKKDIYDIMEWRNEQIDILRQKHLLTKIEQLNYYNNIIKPSFNLDNPNQILFSYLKDNICIGYGGFVHISWEHKRAEISFLLNTERVKNKQTYYEDFKTYLKMIKNIAFQELNFHKIYTETYNINIRKNHLKVIKDSEFKLEGILKEHNIINNIYVDSLIHGYINEE